MGFLAVLGALVVAQVAMALLLLVATGLFLRSLQEAASVDAGFNTDDVDTLQVDVRLAGYRDEGGIRVVDELIVAIINETMAARVFPGRDAVGQQLFQQMGPDADTE